MQDLEQYGAVVGSHPSVQLLFVHGSKSFELTHSYHSVQLLLIHGSKSFELTHSFSPGNLPNGQRAESAPTINEGRPLHGTYV